MKIYTKTGDGGETSLYGGKRVSKDILRIEAYGTIDELNAWLGVLAEYEINQELKPFLRSVQNNLFVIGSLLAADPEKIPVKLPVLNENAAELLENEIDRMNVYLEPMRFFILPGGHKEVAFAHVARTVCRRAERVVIRLHKEEPVKEIIIRYLNRLSDYIFVLCRFMAFRLKVAEVPWQPESRETHS